MARISVVVAALNEEEAIEKLLHGLARQTRRPDEIVLADGGSADATVRVAVNTADELSLYLRVISLRSKIATARNAAIETATGDIIAVTDADCVPSATWLEMLTNPFSDDFTQATSGSYHVDATSPMERAIAVFTWVRQTKGHRFLPSHRSVAYRKKIWREIGGYRDDIDSGEDTYFDLEVEKRGGFYQVPDASVRWRPRRTVPQALRQQFYYGGGDGQAHIQPTYHAACGLAAVAEILSLTGVPYLADFSRCALVILLIRFTAKHVQMFGWSPGDWPRVWLLALLLPPARFLGFALGSAGISVRSLLYRS